MSRPPKYKKPETLEECKKLAELKEEFKNATSGTDLGASLRTIADILELPLKSKGSIAEKEKTVKTAAFMIAAAKTIFKNGLDSDTVLNAFGLFDYGNGCTHISGESNIPPIGERREYFAKNSSFVEDVFCKNKDKYKEYVSYRMIEQKGESIIKKVDDALGARDRRLVGELAQALWSAKSSSTSMNCSCIEKYFEKITNEANAWLILDGNGCAIDVKLPKLEHERRDLIIRRLLEYTYTPESKKRFEAEPIWTWEQLGLTGNPGPVVFKKFIFDVIDKDYNMENQEEAKRRDILFLTLNALSGYEQENGPDSLDILPKERYRHYLENSDYIKLSEPYSNRYKRKSANVATDQFNKFVEFAKSCKDELVDDIFQMYRNGEFRDAISRYADEDAKQGTGLRKPCYTKENFPLPTRRKLWLRKLKELWDQPVGKISILLSSFAVIFFGAFLPLFHNKSSLNRIPVEEVRLGFYNHLMYPEETGQVPIELIPGDATIKDLNVTSSNDAALAVNNFGVFTANKDYTPTSLTESVTVTIIPVSAISSEVKGILHVTIDYDHDRAYKNRETMVDGKIISNTLASRSGIITAP